MISSQSNTLDEFMQQFSDQTDRDVTTFVHSAGEDSDVPLILYVLIPLKVRYSISAAWFMQGVRDWILRSNAYQPFARSNK